MYIRRKVFSRFIDEYGDERLFSTTDYEYDDYGYGERMYASYFDESGNLHREDGSIKYSAEELSKIKEEKVPKSYKAGTANGAKGKVYKEGGYLTKDKDGKPTFSYGRLEDGGDRKGFNKDEIKANKDFYEKNLKEKRDRKGWNKTDDYKKQKYEAGKRAAETKESLREVRNLKNKLGNAKALNKGLLIGIGAAGVGAAGYGAYKYAKARKAKKEQEEKD